MHEVTLRLVSDPVDGGLTVEEADVVVGGSSDGESLSAVPNDVPLVCAVTLAEVLRLRGKRDADEHEGCDI